jgi:putative membrane protein
MKKGNKYPKILLAIFIVVWIVLAISPRYRVPWIAENLLTVVFVGFLILTYRKFRFSNLSYTLFFTYLILHTIGAHFTYTEMPLFEWTREWGRNHFDRFMHFIFGILFFIPAKEFITRKFKIKGFWSYLMAFIVIVAVKGTYEVLEYLHLIVTQKEIIGTHFIGMQGDQWDAQKDMILGMIGSLVAWVGMLIKKKI